MDMEYFLVGVGSVIVYKILVYTASKIFFPKPQLTMYQRRGQGFNKVPPLSHRPTDTPKAPK